MHDLHAHRGAEITVCHVYHREIMQRYGAGNWKDIMGRKIVLSDLGVSSYALEVEAEKDLLVHDFGGTTDVLLEYSWWGKALGRLRQIYPWLRFHVRTHNAEALQKLHRFEIKGSNLRSAIENARATLEALRQDWRCGQVADTLLGISDWDNRHYWRYFTPHRKMRYLPYFVPWPLLKCESKPRSWAERSNSVVCMPWGHDRIGRASIARFRLMARHLDAPAHKDGWAFKMTRGIVDRDGGENLDGLITSVDGAEPWELLCGVRAVAVLTHLGFGTKTTITDGLAAGCHVLIDERLARRLPAEISSACMVLSFRSLPRPDALMARLREPPCGAGLNERFRRQAQEQLRVCLGGGGNKAMPLAAQEAAT